MSFINTLTQKLAEVKEAMFAPPEVAQKRIEICLVCPELSNDQKLCKECGCLVHAKTKLAKTGCPLKKW